MLRPDDVGQKTQADDEPLIKRGEKWIDEELARKWTPGGSAEIGLSGQYSSRVANRLADMYRQNGWSVSVTADPREGGYVLSFRKAPTADEVTAYYNK